MTDTHLSKSKSNNSVFQSTYWDIGRTRLHTLLYPENGPTTLFLHANGMAAGVYTPLLDRLHDRLHMVACDLPGHGCSGPPADNPIRGWHTFVPDLQHLIDRHLTPPINIVGHSLGSVIAFFLAARYPHLCNRLVIIDPAIFSRPMLWMFALISRMGLMHRFPIVKAARRRKNRFDSPQDATQRFMSGKGMFKTWEKPFIQAYLDWAIDFSTSGGQLRCHPETEAQIFSSTPADAWLHAPKIKSQVLLIRGQHSDVLQRGTAQLLSQKIPFCRLQTIPDTTHFVPMEQPGIVADAILNHLAAS